MPAAISTLLGLRARLTTLIPQTHHGVLAFGDVRIDSYLGGGLALGMLHEFAAAGIEAETGAVTTSFIARLLGRLPDTRPVFWIASLCDLYAPGLPGCGLDPGRLVLVQTRDHAETLAAMETVLRKGAAAAVVAETGQLRRTPSRRLQLACLKHGSTGFVLQRRSQERGDMVPEATAAMTRWRITALPSLAEFGDPGLSRWRVELTHVRGGSEGAWILQAGGDPYAAYPFRVVAELADDAATREGRHRIG